MLLEVIAQRLKAVKLLATCERTQLPIMLRPFAWGVTFSVKGSVKGKDALASS